MKNKFTNGFTLVELMGVIIILGLISLIIVPTVNNSLKENKKSLCSTQIDYIVAAAKNYGADNIFSLPDLGGDPLVVTLSKLQSNGYLDEDIVNPLTKKTFSPEPYVTITKTNKGYTYVIDFDTESACE
ncbi:MAG: prepilin-type N-terminal cleavage/methylation domain-containing protein [Bacilli bacterium]